MTYNTIALIQRDPTIRDRVAACVAVEEIANPPEQWVADNAWRLATQPGWAEAWESAVAGHSDDQDYNPAADDAAITDLMILAAVQAIAGAGEGS